MLLPAREGQARPTPTDEGGIKIEGLHNLLFLLGVMGAVIMSGSVKLPAVTVYALGSHAVSVPCRTGSRT